MRRGAGDGVKPDTASAAAQTPGMGLENYVLATLLKSFSNHFSGHMSWLLNGSTALHCRARDLTQASFFPYSRAQVTSRFTGSKRSFEKAKFSKQPISKASESLCTCLPGVTAKCSINRSFWGVSGLFLPWITPSCPAARARQEPQGRAELACTVLQTGETEAEQRKAAVGGCKDPTEQHLLCNHPAP